MVQCGYAQFCKKQPNCLQTCLQPPARMRAPAVSHLHQHLVLSGLGFWPFQRVTRQECLVVLICISLMTCDMERISRAYFSLRRFSTSSLVVCLLKSLACFLKSGWQFSYCLKRFTSNLMSGQKSYHIHLTLKSKCRIFRNAILGFQIYALRKGVTTL